MTYHDLTTLLGWVMLALGPLVLVALLAEPRARTYPRLLRFGYGVLAVGIILSGGAMVRRTPGEAAPAALAIPGDVLVVVGVGMQLWAVLRGGRGRPPGAGGTASG
jgi:hypothetical protein